MSNNFISKSLRATAMSRIVLSSEVREYLAVTSDILYESVSSSNGMFRVNSTKSFLENLAAMYNMSHNSINSLAIVD